MRGQRRHQCRRPIILGGRSDTSERTCANLSVSEQQRGPLRSVSYVPRESDSSGPSDNAGVDDEAACLI